MCNQKRAGPRNLQLGALHPPSDPGYSLLTVRFTSMYTYPILSPNGLLARSPIQFDPSCNKLSNTRLDFTLKVIIQGLLRLYNKNISSNLTKTKALLTTSTSKITLNIDGLTIHSI